MDGQIQHLPLDKIKADNLVRSGEHDEQELIGLAITIREVGQLVPIRVRPLGDGFAIVDGHRRYLATVKLKRPTIAAIVDTKRNESESLHLQWVANCQRSEVSALDRARAIKRLMDVTKWGPTETAKRLGVPGSTVSRAICLLSAPEQIIARVEDGTLAPSTACELAKVTDQVKLAELAQAAAKGELTRDAVSAEVASQTASRAKRKRKSVNKVVVFLDSERSMTVTAPELSLEIFASCLEEALDKVRQIRTRGGDLDLLVRVCRDELKGKTAV